MKLDLWLITLPALQFINYVPSLWGGGGGGGDPRISPKTSPLPKLVLLISNLLWPQATSANPLLGMHLGRC